MELKYQPITNCKLHYGVCAVRCLCSFLDHYGVRSNLNFNKN